MRNSTTVATSNQPFVSAGLAGASVADYNHSVIVTREAPNYRVA
jgi:hypothetical protein